jgi:hypothetical protein
MVHRWAAANLRRDSAALGRLPHPAETMINEELAADGIDELLRGFLPRR